MPSSKGKLLAILGFLAFVSIIVSPAYADQEVKATSGGTLDVGFSTDPASPVPGDQTLLKINFINKSTHSLQVHIDYKVFVKENGEQIFGTPIRHTSEGTISIPLTFQNAGSYEVKVEVDGILFQPIPPETSTFTGSVGGGGGNSALANNTQSNPPPQNTAQNTVKIPNWVRNTAKWWSQGQVGDSDFVKGLQFLIQNNIMQVPHGQSSNSGGSQSIPSWIKKNAGWWADGQISDNEFVKGIQWLITNGIISV